MMELTSCCSRCNEYVSNKVVLYLVNEMVEFELTEKEKAAPAVAHMQDTRTLLRRSGATLALRLARLRCRRRARSG